MEKSEEIAQKIKELEDEKSGLIEEIKKINGRLAYKRYEKKALEPILERNENVNPGPILAKIRRMEFRIETQAYTPQKEREFLTKLKKYREEYSAIKPIVDARRKIKLVESDIEELSKRKDEIEEKLGKIREELRALRRKQKFANFAKSKGGGMGRSEEEDLVSLADLAEMNENEL